MNPSKLWWIALALGLASLAPRAYAEEVIAGSVYDEAKETEVVQTARRRLYPGGHDEGDLTVQPQLLSPTRKMTPQSESNEAPADD